VALKNGYVLLLCFFQRNPVDFCLGRACRTSSRETEEELERRSGAVSRIITSEVLSNFSDERSQSSPYCRRNLRWSVSVIQRYVGDSTNNSYFFLQHPRTTEGSLTTIRATRAPLRVCNPVERARGTPVASAGRRAEATSRRREKQSK
jgi:hypothetical protein